MSFPATASASRPHFMMLDALRGVAALIVILYHVFEAFATSPADQMLNHGYLAVDFFFMLSGFVMCYAYDGRFRAGMKMRTFFKRRLIRLHPMLIAGCVLGVVAFLVQGGVKWSGEQVEHVAVVVAMILTLLMIPAMPGSLAEVRGNGEMFPLNGPVWSLFFEYIGYVIYAVVLRRLSVRFLAAFVALMGAALLWAAVGNLSGYGHIGMGWTLADHNFIGGMLRLMFSFSAGLLLSRLYRPRRFRYGFAACMGLLLIFLPMPHLGVNWLNGLYDALVVIAVFPLIVWLGAGTAVSGRRSDALCRWLGDISYPVYVIHYPAMYLFYAWVWAEELTFSHAWPVAAAIFFGVIILASAFLRYYDKPVRRWLSERSSAIGRN